MSSEVKIVAILAVSLLALEIGTRLAEPRLSKDLAHIRTFSELSNRFSSTVKKDPRAKKTVLILGNSLARQGIDEQILVSGLTDSKGHSPTIGFITPDGTSVTEWVWAYRRYVMHPGASPDLVILVTGRHHLMDDSREQLDIPRLAAFYLDARDRSEFLSRYSIDTEQSIELLLASQSRLLADRTRLRPLLFYRMIPGYEVGVNQINAALGGGVPGESTGIEASPMTEKTETLRLLIESIKASGAHPVVVTVPLPDPYSLSAGVAELLGERGIDTVPLGEAMLLPEERFPDGYHLDRKGAAMVTRELLREIGAN